MYYSKEKSQQEKEEKNKQTRDSRCMSFKWTNKDSKRENIGGSKT